MYNAAYRPSTPLQEIPLVESMFFDWPWTFKWPCAWDIVLLERAWLRTIWGIYDSKKSSNKSISKT